MSHERDARRARGRRREDLRTAAAYLAAMVVGAALGVGIDAWIHS